MTFTIIIIVIIIFIIIITMVFGIITIFNGTLSKRTTSIHKNTITITIKYKRKFAYNNL